MRVYIAGPYTLGDVAQNVAAAIEAGNAVMNAGHTPFVPHLTHFWHLLYPHPYETWLAYDNMWLIVCDAVIRLPGKSLGADQEEQLARQWAAQQENLAWRWAELSIPVFYSIGDFLDYAKG